MALKQALSQIAFEKEEKKKALKKIKNRYITLIYKGLSQRKSIKEIHKWLYDTTINKKSPLLRQAMIETVKIKKKVDNKKDTKYISNAFGVIDPLVVLSMAVFDEIKKNDVDINLNKEITKEVDKKETNSKLEALEDAMSSGNVFYLASSHNDSAKDHKSWQGLMYYNEGYITEVESEIAKREIANYIDKHKLKSVQWVTGKPVYFITRPNCHHFFKEIPVREALTTSVETLIKRYDLHSKTGKRPYLKTLKHRVVGKDYRNAQMIYEKYKERLLLLKDMYKVQPNPSLKNAINKTQLLCERWASYAEKLKGQE